ncbi:short-subunit dehydrogenase [Dysgonomonas sp. PFB1-18]|uniref:SDR family NAD(P)-dependent oxidoreductase n=1 Tax=unclassified Dysgonomonas TaxID=2630389 RepID=UPI0024746BB0|nr:MULTISPECIES: SDR family NAD(P)-dependent oxidoreductase [unclassified Dysgonomonas]MDH6310094.1 short-subunit dehydrogenase [Dysgonomonas sp. PF1-14]MDH6340240.1 short-subunit dehydrogenase [Dysgonomonas sp. PF1-16]MDH6381651.1 short-subunit dehydrogenase [Dysgonomonas sp. PFB1-18]MDH6399010.1 short-subunit dehydrogenase [Dysgonomonas sp. PF1-23]
MNLTGKNIILTGASSGIGKEILDILSAYPNTKIIAVARHTENILQTENIFPLALDVSTKEGVDKLFDSAQEIFGSIDAFIANAGFAYLEKLTAPDWQHIENIYNLNVFSPIYSLEKLAETADNRPVAFACTISGAGLASLPGYSLYCSSKAALHHFIQTYRYEQRKNIQITAVYPVATRTDFFDKATGEDNTPLPFPTQDAKTVAKKIVRGIEKGRKNIYPSLLFRVFYPVGRAFPFLMKIYSLREKRKVSKWLG